MGYESIPKLLLTMSAPIAFSMLFQSLYNVVDSIFVSRVGEEALAAVSLAFPVQSLMNAVAIGTGVGMNALLSKSLGERKFEKANVTAQTGLFLTLASAIIFVFIGLFLSEAFFATQTNDPLIHEYGVQYLTIINIFSVGLFLQIIFERLLQSTGLAFLSMITQIAGALFNIIFDPILIFGLGPFPELGVAGAAYATVGGQILAVFVGIYYNVKKNKELNLLQKNFKLEFDTIRKIYSVGLPTIILISINSFAIFVLNTILAGFSATAVVAYGIYFKLQSFVFMPIFGINNGLIPIISYNYGAGKKERIYEAIKVAMMGALVIMAVGFLLFQIIPTQLLLMFQPSEELMRIGKTALRISSFSFILAAVPIISSSVFQSLGSGTISMVVTMIRQLFILAPAAYLLSLTGDINNIWFAQPISEVVSIFVALYFLRKILRNKVDILHPIEWKE